MTPEEIQRELDSFARSQALTDEMILEEYAGDGVHVIHDEEGTLVVTKAEMREIARLHKEWQVEHSAEFCRLHGIRAWPVP